MPSENTEVRLDLVKLLDWLDQSDMSFDEDLLFSEVSKCLSANLLCPPESAPPAPKYCAPCLGEEAKYRDWERVAWFVRYGWQDAISVDVGVPAFSVPPALFDGRHRLAAAIYKRDPWILVDPGGSCTIIEHLTYRND
jgi:hypothetical protein